jgi:hypothetical protein
VAVLICGDAPAVKAKPNITAALAKSAESYALESSSGHSLICLIFPYFFKTQIRQAVPKLFCLMISAALLVGAQGLEPWTR